MYAQLSLIISLHLFILPRYHAYSQSEYAKYYLECNKTFNCGENVTGIGYPFWVGDRPSYCRPEGLIKLSCENIDDEDFATTLDIGSDKFRVLNINMSSYEITMEREPDDILPCPQKILNSAKFIETKFGYGPNDGQGSGDLQLFYCPLEWLNINMPGVDLIRNNFTCKSQGYVGFFGNETLLQDFPFLHDCKIKVGIPVNRTVLEELGKNEMMELKDLSSPSFVVYYGISEPACSACMKSGGLCWSGINPTDPPCLCRHGAYPSKCPNQSGMFIFFIVSTSLR